MLYRHVNVYFVIYSLYSHRDWYHFSRLMTDYFIKSNRMAMNVHLIDCSQKKCFHDLKLIINSPTLLSIYSRFLFFRNNSNYSFFTVCFIYNPKISKLLFISDVHAMVFHLPKFFRVLKLQWEKHCSVDNYLNNYWPMKFYRRIKLEHVFSRYLYD